MFLPIACDDDPVVAHGPPDVLGDAGTDGAAVEPELPVGIARLPDVASGGSAESDILALGVLERLEGLCGECHTNDSYSAGFSGGLDLAGLIESGLIVPGSSASSPLLQRIVDGSMPPPETPRVRAPTVGDIAVLTDFIDQLSTEPGPSCEPLPFVGRDAVYAALLADVQSRPADERRYLRYVSSSEASNARLCGPALEQQRLALFKLVNSLSMESEIHVPTAIDAAALLYRIDLRDYGWAREIDLDGDGEVDHADGWQAALAAAPYGVAFDGPEATALSAETGAPVPLSSLSAFVRGVSDGDVYRALLGVAANRYDMELALGLDTVAEFIDLNVQRAGLQYPPNSDLLPYPDVLVTRFPLGELDQRAYWVFDGDDGSVSGSTYENPLRLSTGEWTKTLWELPNGLLGYLVNDSDGAALSEIPGACAGTCVRPALPHPIACMGCHADGLRPLEDVIRSYVENHPVEFDPETFADVLAFYPPPAELDQIIAGDNDRYRAALERVGIQPGAPDPISRVYLDFDRALDLDRAAAELGVSAQTLADQLGVLPPAFAALGTPSATIDRAAFDEGHATALCVVHAGSRNRPAACP